MKKIDFQKLTIKEASELPSNSDLSANRECYDCIIFWPTEIAHDSGYMFYATAGIKRKGNAEYAERIRGVDVISISVKASIINREY